MKNLQQLRQVTVCAAFIALCLIGAGWFVTQPVAGQEAKPQTLHGAAALERLKQDGQYDSLQAAMEQARFSVSREANTPLGRWAWRAPNASAGYDAYVTEAGVSIALDEQTYVSLHLCSLGYGAALHGIAAGEVNGDLSGNGQSITITRDNVSEWFVNGADGLEHGFTLNEPPSGARQQGLPLRLALAVSEGWQAIASEDGRLVTLRNGHDHAVEYGKLSVHDELGMNLPARLTVVDEQVVIEVEDHDAQYPLTIDPLFTLQQRLLAANGAAGDYLGYAVALDGNTALVGAPFEDNKRGAAYVFVRNGALWSQQAKLLAQDGTSFDYFGQSVALKGDTAVVGATYGPGDLHPEQGAAYVFVRGGTTWSLQKKLNASEKTVGAQFGAAVALDGDTVIIGAPTYTITPSFADIGVVFIFTRTGGNWTQQARLNANDGEDGDAFGSALALEGDTALVGAPNNAVTVGGQGAAYVFTRTGTSWTQRQRLLTNSAPDDHFGNAVALSGDKALIGAYQRDFDIGVAPDCGAVYDFRRGASGWTQNSQFFAPNRTAGAQFGVSLALSGDTAVIGASRGLFQPGADQRSAYVFVYGGEWFPVRHLGPELGSATDGFGYAVALSGDTVLVGAYRSDATALDQGAAYAFVLHDSQHVEQQKVFANDGAAGDYFGTAVALDGNTLVAGTESDDIGTNSNQGSVYVFIRNGASWTFQQKLTANDGAAGDHFGLAAALSGDTLVAGAEQDDIGGNQDQGSAYIFTRNGAVWTFQQKLMSAAIDGLPNDRFGASVALGGDTVVVGARGQNDYQGSAYVFTRNGTVWTQQPKLTANDGAAGDEFGYAVALSGDTLAVGAPYDAIGTNMHQGSAYVFTRTGTAWTFQRKVTANDGGAFDYFGGAVALHGDTLAVGAEGDQIGANLRQGSVYVFTRTGTAQSVWTQHPKITANDGAAEDNFGRVVALSGDLLVVGASGRTVGTSRQQGVAYVFTRLGYFVQQQKLSASDGREQDRFGGAVAVSGDTVAVGALNANIGTNDNQGAAYVFVAPRCPALTITPGSLPNGVIGAAYEQFFNIVSEADNFAVSGGALPPGLTLNNAGRLSGLPTAAGTYRFAVTATTYPSGCPRSRSYTLTINAAAIVCVSAASYLPGSAPESIVAAFGVQMSQQTQAAASVPLPTTLAGVTVRIRDSQNVERLAPLFFVSPGQINLQIPAGTATGTATVTLSTGAIGQVEIKNTSPGLFAANADGQGVPAAVALRVKANGAQSYEAVAQFNGTRFMPMPIDLGPAGEQVFLVLYGTGLRFKQTVTASLGGMDANVLFVGAAAGFVGLDQINLAVPRALIGRGDVDLMLRVDNASSNTLRVNIR